jgi:hypothetical protein
MRRQPVTGQPGWPNALWLGGLVPTRAFPFEENTLTWLSESRRLSPGAVAALHLAWTHQKFLFE